jgi:hypothetical protein
MRLGDLPLFVDHIRDAFCVLVVRRLRRTVGESDLAFRVAQEREWEVELAGERVVLFGSVEADAEDLGVLGLVLLAQVPEPGTFTRSTRGVGLRVEPEHDFLAAQVSQTDMVSLVVEDVEVRSDITGLQHFVILLTHRLTKVSRIIREVLEVL